MSPPSTDRIIVNGATAFKRRVLEAMGWKVGEVEWWRWKKEGPKCLKDVLKPLVT